jgi:sporulation protein YlmC with PRC-barrel domain
MFRSIKELTGYAIHAADGNIGRVHDFYFDDQTWAIRYLVVDTGGWLSSRKVLVAPVALDVPKWESKTLPVRLTKEQVEKSPSIDLDKPVSRQMEEELYAYYGWRPYWRDARARAAVRVIEKSVKDESSQLSLRSVDEVIGYDIQASDGEIGHAADLIIDDEAWIIRYIVVDTHDWLPGKKVLVSPSWTGAVTWPERNIYVGLSREMVKNSPEFDPSAPVNREYELRLYDYYGRPKYWTEV